MPRTTRGGGYSDKNLPELEGQLELPFGEPVPEPDAQEDARAEEPEAQQDGGIITGDYSTYTVRELVRECQERGVSYSGTSGTLNKAELVAKLSEQE